MAKEKSKSISLVERAFALPDSDKEFGMKLADHKLICHVLDAHLEATQEKTDEQNERFSKKLLADVIEVIGQELRPFKEENEKAHQRIINRIAKLENYASIKWTLIRWGVAVIIAVLVGLLLFAWHENRKIAENNAISEQFKNREYLIEKAPVRGGDIVYPTTAQGIDSLENEQIKSLIK